LPYLNAAGPNSPIDLFCTPPTSAKADMHPSAVGRLISYRLPAPLLAKSRRQ
jgi:hypothetical protein